MRVPTACSPAGFPACEDSSATHWQNFPWPSRKLLPILNQQTTTTGASVMKTYQPADLRSFAIVGHASSGKTTLAEAMLVCAGIINRMGNIAQGNTVSDYHEDE